MTLELWLDEHFSKAGPMVRSLIVDGFPQLNDPKRGTAILRDLQDSSAILSRDHEMGECPVSTERQVVPRLAHFSKILDATKARSQDVVRVQMFLRDCGAWLLINPRWWERFPNPTCRPTRHAIRSELPEGRIIQLVATANLEEG